MGRRPNLVGGGLIRSQGGWSQVMTMRKRKIRELYDERILGSGDFVERIIEEAEENFKRSLKNNLFPKGIESLIRQVCEEAGILVEEIRSGSRRAMVSAVRSKLAQELVRQRGITMAETARQLGVSTPAISFLLSQKENE